MQWPLSVWTVPGALIFNRTNRDMAMFKKGMKVRMTAFGLSLGRIGSRDGVITGFPGANCDGLFIRRAGDTQSYIWDARCWEPVNPKKK